jgi:hypothetical protein
MSVACVCASERVFVRISCGSLQPKPFHQHVGALSYALVARRSLLMPVDSPRAFVGVQADPTSGDPGNETALAEAVARDGPLSVCIDRHALGRAGRCQGGRSALRCLATRSRGACA